MPEEKNLDTYYRCDKNHMSPKSPSKDKVMFQVQCLERHSKNGIWYRENSNLLDYVLTWLKLLLCCHNREKVGEGDGVHGG